MQYACSDLEVILHQQLLIDFYYCKALQLYIILVLYHLQIYMISHTLILKRGVGAATLTSNHVGSLLKLPFYFLKLISFWIFDMHAWEIFDTASSLINNIQNKGIQQSVPQSESLGQFVKLPNLMKKLKTNRKVHQWYKLVRLTVKGGGPVHHYQCLVPQ